MKMKRLLVILSLFFWHSAFAAGLGFNTQPIPGLVGWWTFNEGSGVVANDYSGMGNTGYLTNSPGWLASAVVSGGLVFTSNSVYASATYVRISNSPSLNPSQLTLAGWINHTSGCALIVKNAVADNGSPADPFQLYSLTYVKGDGAYFNLSATTPGSRHILHTGDIIPENQWWHVAGVCDGSSMQFYTNGILMTNWTGSCPIGSNGHPVKIGASLFVAPDVSAKGGKVDDVRIYSRALTADEIKMLYNGGAGSQR